MRIAGFAAGSESDASRSRRKTVIPMKTIALVFATCAALVSIEAGAVECDVFMRMRGLATRAQFQCGFNRYSTDILEQARACRASMSEASAKRNLRKGMDMFDAEAKDLGKRQACDRC